MRRDMAQCDRFGRHAGEQGAGFLAGKEVQTTLLNVAQARREAVAEEGHETEHMVRCSTRIGVVLLDRHAGLVIQQAIQDIGRFACGRRDHPARKGIISIRDMGVEGDARFVAAARVDVTDRGPTTAGMKLLSVARRGGAVRSDEHTSELQSLMRTSYAVFCLNTNTANISSTPRTNTY